MGSQKYKGARMGGGGEGRLGGGEGSFRRGQLESKGLRGWVGLGVGGSSGGEGSTLEI